MKESSPREKESVKAVVPCTVDSVQSHRSQIKTNTGTEFGCHGGILGFCATHRRGARGARSDRKEKNNRRKSVGQGVQQKHC